MLHLRELIAHMQAHPGFLLPAVGVKQPNQSRQQRGCSIAVVLCCAEQVTLRSTMLCGVRLGLLYARTVH